MKPANRRRRRAKAKLAEFRVEARQLKYLGEFVLEGCGNVHLTLQDRWASVSPQAGSRYPKLPVGRVVVEVPTLIK